MSSLSRRACFKCGNVGHYAGEQPSIPGAGLRYTILCCQELESQDIALDISSVVLACTAP